ncbi:MAG: FAD-dependent oxidoreductase [Verrucomicrobia bacterium]|nr:FAD-dependent oxidoreductase [Verrucomicrobiota bacterium]
MILAPPVAHRSLRLERLAADLVVAGGGLAGTCCALAAARAGLRVILVHDRPVLGGNSSSEVRLWVLGATSHMGNNNRWAREGGVVDELLLENQFRNPEGNPLIWDTILLEKVRAETRLTLLLNTAVHEVDKADADTIRAVRAFCSQNSTAYELGAPLFVDATGDGLVGFLAGAAFRLGAESRAEFGEPYAPAMPTRDLLGHSIYFYSKDAGRPVRFVPPSFALRDIAQVPRYRDFNAAEHGCRLWWIEYGGVRDTVHDTEEIKWELWKVVYGVWDYIKNSGRFPEAENLTLEWVGTIPGKRESRRFEGDYLLVQQDIIEQRRHPDAVSAGGWAIDLHPPEGVFSPQPGCQQWHAKGIYQIPYRCLYSRNITNLFLAGRLISASHIAFGSTRVMATCAHSAQAVGVAAAICRRDGVRPRDVLASARMADLQQRLLRVGQFIPNVPLRAPTDLALQARIHASSVLRLDALPAGSERLRLTESWASLLPVPPGPAPVVEYKVDVARDTELIAELRVSGKACNHTPDRTLATLRLPLKAGRAQTIPLRFAAGFEQACYAFYCPAANDAVAVHLSDRRLTGVLAVTQKFNAAVSRFPRQEPPPGSGIEAFEFWLPQRRPLGKNLACRITPPLAAFEPSNLTNGFARPTNQPNAWVSAFDDPAPTLTLEWPTPVLLERIELGFDTDFDHPLETVLLLNPETVSPFCVPGVQAYNENGQLLGEIRDNHQSVAAIQLVTAAEITRLTLRLTPPAGGAPVALLRLSCFGPEAA